MYVVITGLSRPLLVKASLTVHLAHAVADAFTGNCNPERVLHNELVSACSLAAGETGESCHTVFKWYCVDMSHPTKYVVTFSRRHDPVVMEFQGNPVRIADPDLTLTLSQVECIRTGRLATNVTHGAYRGPPETRHDDQ